MQQLRFPQDYVVPPSHDRFSRVKDRTRSQYQPHLCLDLGIEISSALPQRQELG